MRILVVSSNYFPEPVGIGLFSTDLAETLCRKGDEVTVITTYPYYPWWKTPYELGEYGVKQSALNGVQIYRTPLNFGLSSKTLGRIVFEFRMWLGMRRVLQRIEEPKFDRVVSIIPSLSAGLVARKFAKATRIPNFLIIQDISSNGVSESGMSFGFALKRIVFLIERMIIRSADSISVISQSMVEPISGMMGRSIPVAHIPNYEIEAPESTSALTREDFGISPQDFVVIHAGSIAQKQGLTNLIEAARILESTNVSFYLFGHGNAEEEIFQKSKNLSNFFIKPPVPRDQFSSLLRCADLLIVNERSTQISMALPSKIISYFGSGVPVIAAVPKSGATKKAIEGLAFWVEADDPRLLAAEIQKVAQSEDARKFYADAALQYFNQHLRSESGRERILLWLRNSSFS